MQVIVQIKPEWPAKVYSFKCEKCANMFAHSCRRDGDFRVEVRA